jgi:L-arabinokinase
MPYPIDQDFEAWEDTLRRQAPGFFAPQGVPVFVARAPGRLDVMGGTGDYSGSLVAEMPIAQAALAGAQRDDAGNGAVTVRSGNAPEEGLQPEVTLPADAFVNPTALLKFLRDGPVGARWAGYVAGSVALLRAEGFLPRGAGARFFVHSSVPLGAGVSSSAALEVASLRALCAAFDITMDALTLARLCQRVENEVMDAPCGIMDQVTSALGEEGRLLVLLCQPYQLQGTVALPPGWSVFGIDSAVKHSVGGAAYTQARVAAFMGYKILADRAGSGFGGYLCNVSPDEYRALMPERLPETMGGAVFLGAHGGIFDTVTRVDPKEMYPVRACAEHAIFEHARVQRFLELLKDGSDAAMQDAGEQMYAAHASYSACGLGAPETDLLVDLARSQRDNVAGARITGGGSGGAVALLVRAETEERVAQAVADEYARRSGSTPRLIRGASPGAFAVDVRQISPLPQRGRGAGGEG